MINKLPYEIIQIIVHYMPVWETILLARTCRYLRQILRDDNFWKNFYLRDFQFDLHENNPLTHRCMYFMEKKFKTVLKNCYYLCDTLNLGRIPWFEPDKISLVVARVKQTIQLDPNGKIIIVCATRKTGESIVEKLSMFGAQYLRFECGKLQDIISNFNNKDHALKILVVSHLLIMNGIDFGDKNNEVNRYMFIIANIEELIVLQCAARIMRVNNKSRARIEVLNNTKMSDYHKAKDLQKNIFFLHEASLH